MKLKFRFLIIAFLMVFSIFGIANTMAVSGDWEYETSESVVETLSSSEVKTLQTKLKRWGYYSGAVDGIYGPKTIAAVKSFQKKNNLTADGVVGPKTASALGMTISSSTTKQTSSDQYLLAKCIHAEARGEPYTGQVAVGAVILNRVKNANFPNTIAGVIYQKNAFTCVSDGQINLEPNSSALSAAKDALNGWDPTSGCIYYFNPSTATSSWIWSRPQVITIGKHIFAL